MSWTYSGNPAASNRDFVRFLTGQTSSDDAVIMNDEELSFLLVQRPNPYFAAAMAAERLAVRYGNTVRSKTVGDLTLNYGERETHYRTLSGELRRQGMTQNIRPFVGGSSISDVDARKEDTDRVQGAFSVGMDDRDTSS